MRFFTCVLGFLLATGGPASGQEQPGHPQDEPREHQPGRLAEAGHAEADRGATTGEVLTSAGGGVYTDISTGPDGLSVNGQIGASTFGPDGSLYVAGTFSAAGDVPVQNIARWDGSAWHAVGAGVGGSAFSLALGPDGTLYVGGRFTTAGGVPANGIARWDGAAWSAVGDGSSPGPVDVWSLTVAADGRLYAGGTFSRIGGTAAANLARWDGMAWQSLAGGVNSGSVLVLHEDAAGNVFAGGTFAIAGGQVSPNIARYTPAPVASEPAAGPAAALTLSVSPNPARGAATATVTHAAGPVTVEVLDALGRRVAHVTAEGGAETHTLALPVGRLAPGAYVVRVISGGAAVSRPVVVVR